MQLFAEELNGEQEEEEVKVYRVMQGPAEFRGNVNATSAITFEYHFKPEFSAAKFWMPSAEYAHRAPCMSLPLETARQKLLLTSVLLLLRMRQTGSAHLASPISAELTVVNHRLLGQSRMPGETRLAKVASPIWPREGRFVHS